MLKKPLKSWGTDMDEKALIEWLTDLLNRVKRIEEDTLKSRNHAKSISEKIYNLISGRQKKPDFQKPVHVICRKFTFEHIHAQ
jgi:hypothetical protein